MKRFLSVLLTFAMVFSLSSSCFAVADEYSILSGIAGSTIQASQVTQENGAVLHTFSCLDVFVNAVHKAFPKMSDYDIAKFIFEYTGRDSSSVPEETILEGLQYDNVSVSTSYVRVTKKGDFVELSEEEAMISLADSKAWTSSGGLLRIQTGFIKKSTDGNRKLFNIYASAEWLNPPINYRKAAFALGCNGLFDSRYLENGYVFQTYTCNDCGAETQYNRAVNASKPSNGGLVLRYDTQKPHLTFHQTSSACMSCYEPYGDCTFLKAYLCYGVIIEGSGSMQAAYGRTTFIISGINVSIDDKGAPRISATAGSGLDTWNARPVTLI